MKKIVILMALFSIASLQANPITYAFICPETGAVIYIGKEEFAQEKVIALNQKIKRLTTLAAQTKNSVSRAVIIDTIRQLRVLQLSPDPAAPQPIQPKQAFTPPPAPQTNKDCFCSIL